MNSKDLEKDFQKLTGIGFQDFLRVDINKFPWLEALEGFHGKNSNADKVFLYNDCFCGVYDPLLTGNEAKHYAETAKGLRGMEKGKFAYVFKTLRALSEVLALKADIGVRTRQAYRQGDKISIRKLAEDYATLEKRIKSFYKLFRLQWLRENKPFGLEVQDMRLGGLMQRIKSCRQTLLEYCAGKTDAIPELETEILPLPEWITDKFGHFLFGGHLQIVSMNVI